MSEKIKIGISIGDVNGIGLEIIIKTLADSPIYNYCTPIVYGHTKVASFYRRTTNVEDLNFFVINHPSEVTGKKDHRKPNMINCWEEDVKIEPGVANAAVGKYAFISLERATTDLINGDIGSVVNVILKGRANVRIDPVVLIMDGLGQIDVESLHIFHGHGEGTALGLHQLAGMFQVFLFVPFLPLFEEILKKFLAAVTHGIHDQIGVTGIGGGDVHFQKFYHKNEISRTI